MSDTASAKETFANSIQNGNHKLLSRLTGEWEGSTKTWFELDVLADESPMQGTIKSILGGRFMMHEYKGSLQGKPFGEQRFMVITSRAANSPVHGLTAFIWALK